MEIEDQPPHPYQISLDRNNIIQEHRHKVNNHRTPQKVTPQPHTQIQQLHIHPLETTESDLKLGRFMYSNDRQNQGFGSMYYDPKDQLHHKQNTPIPQESEDYIVIAIFNVVFVGSLIFGVVAMNNILSLPVALIIILVPYFIYLLIAYCCNNTLLYLSTIKPIRQSAERSLKMSSGKIWFQFWIQCYHIVHVQTKKGMKRRKEVTHTATEIFPIQNSIDQSQSLTDVQASTDDIFVDNVKRYYFSNEQSKDTFVKTFNKFVGAHSRDNFQNYSHTLQVQNFEDKMAFSKEGTKCKRLALFHIFVLLGLAYPYFYFKEKSITRCQVNIVKKITL